jgi:hypothetical protein
MDEKIHSRSVKMSVLCGHLLKRVESKDQIEQCIRDNKKKATLMKLCLKLASFIEISGARIAQGKI